jgi:hypothetical protein
MVFNQRTPQYHRRNAPRLDLVGERLNMQTITIPGPSVAYSHDRSGFRQSIPFMGPASTHPRSMEYHGQAQSSGTRYTTAPPQYPPPPNWTWDYRQPPPLAFHHWTPPENLQAQSQSQPQSQTQNPATPTLDSSAPAKPSASNLRSGQNSPIHKRKDERSHRKVPPPSSRVPDASAERQDPNDSSRRIWSQPHRRQISDVSSTRGARDNDEGESSEQFSEMTPIPTDLSSTHNTSDSAVGTSQTQEVGVGSRHASSKRQ